MELRGFPVGASIRSMMVMEVSPFRSPPARALAALKMPSRPSMRALPWFDVRVGASLGDPVGEDTRVDAARRQGSVDG